MGSKSNYLENKLLDYVFGKTAFDPPGTIYAGLWTATLDDASTGATAGEVAGSGYARVAIVNGTADWDAASGGTKSNTNVVNFGTAGADWGTVTDFALLDANSEGNILYFGALTASKVISNGDSATIAAGALDITED